MSKYPEKEIRVMLHALGIANHNNGDYIQPNKRYSPYPTSYRNYYQVYDCEHWNNLVNKEFAIFRKGNENWQDFYFVTSVGKDYLKSLGYKWHEKKSRK